MVIKHILIFTLVCIKTYRITRIRHGIKWPNCQRIFIENVIICPILKIIFDIFRALLRQIMTITDTIDKVAIVALPQLSPIFREISHWVCCFIMIFTYSYLMLAYRYIHYIGQYTTYCTYIYLKSNTIIASSKTKVTLVFNYLQCSYLTENL